MSEKTPDFTPAPSILPQGMYGPDHFAVSNSQERTYESAQKRGFKMIDRSEVPADVLNRLEYKNKVDENGQKIEAYTPKDIFLSSGDQYKAYDTDTFNGIQAAWEKAHQDKREELYAEAHAQFVDHLADQHSSPEQAIDEAEGVFYDRLNRMSDDYKSVVAGRRASAVEGANELFSSQNRAEQAAKEAYAMLRRGVDQPEVAIRAINDALDHLNGIQGALTMAGEAASTVSSAANQLLAHATEHKETVLRLSAEFVAVVSRIGETNGGDRLVSDKVSGQASEATSGQVTNATWLESSAGDLIASLGSSDGASGEVRQRVLAVAAQLEEMSFRAPRLGVNGDEYMAVVQAVRRIVDGLGEGMDQARRIASAAGEL